jgi:Zn-dependent protease
LTPLRGPDTFRATHGRAGTGFLSPDDTLDSQTVTNFLIAAPVLLFSMVAHEYAHGYAALRQGDATAYQLGRLTWNPVKHIDPFMTVLMPLILFVSSNGSVVLGGAKPVPVNPRNFRQYRRGDIIVSLAGIATNLVLAIVCTALFAVFGFGGQAVPDAGGTLAVLQRMMIYGVMLNLVLAVFNLLPIPPLDGSHVMKYLLPPALALRYQQIGAYGMLLLVLLLFVGQGVLDAWLAPARLLFRALLGAVLPLMLPGAWPF